MRHKFTGQEEDAETGLMYYGARYYDPYIGSFITPDSLIPEPEFSQSFNRYMYTYGNPVRYNDPTGHEAESPNGGNYSSLNFSPDGQLSDDSGIKGGALYLQVGKNRSAEKQSNITKSDQNSNKAKSTANKTKKPGNNTVNVSLDDKSSVKAVLNTKVDKNKGKPSGDP